MLRHRKNELPSRCKKYQWSVGTEQSCKHKNNYIARLRKRHSCLYRNTYSHYQHQRTGNDYDGGGTVETGNFSTIDWVAGPYFLKTETDPAGGTSYNISGVSQLLSVPYALQFQFCRKSRME